MAFHLMFVHVVFSSARVAEWPPFGKKMLTRLTICSICIFTICYLVISRFGFEGGIWGLIVPVPVHCILVTLVFQSGTVKIGMYVYFNNLKIVENSVAKYNNIKRYVCIVNSPWCSEWLS